MKETVIALRLKDRREARVIAAQLNQAEQKILDDLQRQLLSLNSDADPEGIIHAATESLASLRERLPHKSPIRFRAHPESRKEPETVLFSMTPETSNIEFYETYTRSMGVFQPVYEDFLRKHYALKDHLTSYKAGFLQYKDSQIAERVIGKFTQEGIPVLCIHDSFIIQEDRKEDLRKEMLKAYAEISLYS